MKRSIIKKLTAAALCCILLISCAGAEDTAADERAWYLERADLLCSELYELISFENFAQFFTASEDVAAQIDAWKTGMQAEPVGVSAYDMPSVELLVSMLGSTEAIPEMPKPLIKRLSRSLGSTLISTLNARHGTIFLAAASTATLSEGYIMPEGFTPCLIIYEYDDFCVCVTFAQSGEETVQATAQICSDTLSQTLSMIP